MDAEKLADKIDIINNQKKRMVSKDVSFCLYSSTLIRTMVKRPSEEAGTELGRAAEMNSTINSEEREFPQPHRGLQKIKAGISLNSEMAKNFPLHN